MKHSSRHTKNNGKGIKRRSWDIGEKRRLATEAKEKGLQATARNHNMPSSLLQLWMLQDFSKIPDTKKRLPGAGRRRIQ